MFDINRSIIFYIVTIFSFYQPEANPAVIQPHENLAHCRSSLSENKNNICHFWQYLTEQSQAQFSEGIYLMPYSKDQLQSARKIQLIYQDKESFPLPLYRRFLMQVNPDKTLIFSRLAAPDQLIFHGAYAFFMINGDSPILQNKEVAFAPTGGKIIFNLNCVDRSAAHVVLPPIRLACIYKKEDPKPKPLPDILKTPEEMPINLKVSSGIR